MSIKQPVNRTRAHYEKKKEKEEDRSHTAQRPLKSVTRAILNGSEKNLHTNAPTIRYQARRVAGTGAFKGAQVKRQVYGGRRRTCFFGAGGLHF